MLWVKLVFVLVIWGALASPGWALSVVQKNFDQLVQEAEVVLVGTVHGMTGKKLEPSGVIVTDILLGELKVVKGGHAEQTYTLQVLGGTYGEENLKVSGAPHFETGETYVVFVRGNTKEIFPLVGVTQGKFRVIVDPSTNAEIVVDAKNRAITKILKSHKIMTDSLDASTDHAKESRMTFSEFIEEIESRISE